MEKQQSPWQDTSLLGIVELVFLQENLLPRLEGRHAQVRAAGTAECIPQVALARERKALSVIRFHFQVSSPGQEVLCTSASMGTETVYLLPPSQHLVSVDGRAVQALGSHRNESLSHLVGPCWGSPLSSHKAILTGQIPG